MKTNDSLISVIIPCYDQAHFLPDALQSVLIQTYPHWECIIVNDGSCDKTEEIAKEWQKKDPRFRSISKKNGGLSSARNAGLNLASGDFIQFLDADDIILPDKFRLQLETMSSEATYTLCYCDYYPSREYDLYLPIKKFITPKFKTASFLKEMIIRWESSLSIPCHCFLFSRNIIKENSILFDTTLKNHEDWDFWMKIFLEKPMVTFVPQELAVYRVHDSSMSRDIRSMKEGFIEAILKQRKQFKTISTEYILLTVKYLKLKFRINRQNKLVQLVIKNIKTILRLFGKTFDSF